MKNNLVVLFIVALVLPCMKAYANHSNTQYPIVMVGGATAFDTFDLGFVSIDYWHGITDELRDEGAEVYVTNLSGVQSNDVRGQELIDDILAILDLSGATKVNLIAHSQGALASRYAAAVLGSSKVASVTTVAGMNRGTHISPWSRTTLNEAGLSGPIFDGLTELFAGLIFTLGWEGGSAAGQDGDYNSPTRKWQSFLALEAATNPEFVAEFNEDYPAGLPTENCMNDVYNGQRGDVSQSNNTVVNGIRYFSVGANSNASLTNTFEFLDPVYWLITGVLNGFVVPNFDNNYQWDGLVPQCGHKLGYHIDDYAMSHFDSINHFLGIAPPFIKDIYTTQANRLKTLGL